jgi:hypothetical protein
LRRPHRPAPEFSHPAIRQHCRTEVIALIHNTEATVMTTDGTIISQHTLDPARGYQPKRKNG